MPPLKLPDPHARPRSRSGFPSRVSAFLSPRFFFINRPPISNSSIRFFSSRSSFFFHRPTPMVAGMRMPFSALAPSSTRRRCSSAFFDHLSSPRALKFSTCLRMSLSDAPVRPTTSPMGWPSAVRVDAPDAPRLSASSGSTGAATSCTLDTLSDMNRRFAARERPGEVPDADAGARDAARLGRSPPNTTT